MTDHNGAGAPGMDAPPAASGDTSAFRFEGTWQEFAPIAFTNLLLTIVTLGIYRFWATTRERQYLWSRSRFVDETLEWNGTGMELFIGFLLVLVLLVAPFFLLSQLAQAMVLRGQEQLGSLITLVSFVVFFYLAGVARFRALRYRLSRTRWRGIRGGSDDRGFRFGLSYMWKTIFGYLPLGLLIPWSMTSLWNERWSKMSFGPYGFEANADPVPVFKRFLLFYLMPFVFIIAGGTMAAAFMGMGSEAFDSPELAPGFIIAIFVGILGIYLALGLIAVAFYAAFYREAVGATHWGDVQFEFNASTMDWFKLILGDVALVALTLGVGYIFLSYRHWKFFIVHMDARGEILLDELTQSQTATAGHGEGLLDAFDVGAI